MTRTLWREPSKFPKGASLRPPAERSARFGFLVGGRQEGPRGTVGSWAWGLQQISRVFPGWEERRA